MHVTVKLSLILIVFMLIIPEIRTSFVGDSTENMNLVMACHAPPLGQPIAKKQGEIPLPILT